jgi:hypothetical protein
MTDPRPPVLIVGGYMTAPPNYWPMRRRLRRRETVLVDIAPIWPPDWALAALLGLGLVMARAKVAITRAYRAGGNRPIMVVAHSGGGIAVRLAMSSTPFHGRRGGLAEAVGCLVTLGTPHMLAGLHNRYRHAGHDAAEFLERESPGAYFAPRTAYLTVGSQHRLGLFGGYLARASDDVFSMVVGRDDDTRGDGIVPVGAVHLAGAEQMTFDDVVHGHIGSPWYGDDRVIDRWWPVAVRLWREAIEARAAGAAPVGPRAPEVAKAAEQGAMEQAEAEAVQSAVEAGPAADEPPSTGVVPPRDARRASSVQ